MESKNCECECDKSCDIGECLDYSNCKCRKKLVDPLVEERTENIHEYDNKNKYSFFVVYIVLFSIIFTINIGIGGYITVKKFNGCEHIHSVNPLYLIINYPTGYFKEKTVKNI